MRLFWSRLGAMKVESPRLAKPRPGNLAAVGHFMVAREKKQAIQGEGSSLFIIRTLRERSA